MGSPCDIQFYAKDEYHARNVADIVIADVRRLERRYSRYRSDSFLSQINHIAKLGGDIEVDVETASLLNYANTCYQQSEGLFDITSGILRKAWRFDQQKLPDPQQISSLLTHVGWDKVSWKAPKLSFSLPKMELDFGGIVKEYAADRVAALCLHSQVKHGAINLGGDIKIIGPHPDNGPWSIGIRHPRNTSAIITQIQIYEGALASSGDYERCIQVANKRYGHILNPKTGWPVDHFASVSVVSDFCVIAGSVATIAMLKEKQGNQWLSDLGLEHYWITTQGDIGGTLFSKKTL